MTLREIGTGVMAFRVGRNKVALPTAGTAQTQSKQHGNVQKMISLKRPQLRRKRRLLGPAYRF